MTTEPKIYINSTKKWILCDYPEKEIKKGTEAGKAIIKLEIPKALRSMIDSEVQRLIKMQWVSRYARKDEKGRDLIIVAL